MGDQRVCEAAAERRHGLEEGASPAIVDALALTTLNRWPAGYGSPRPAQSGRADQLCRSSPLAHADGASQWQDTRWARCIDRLDDAVGREAALSQAQGDGPTTFLTFQRHADQRPCGLGDARQLALLAPHVRNVLPLHRRLALMAVGMGMLALRRRRRAMSRAG
jgi:hypothetical protein